MRRGDVDIVLVGADRVAANGDVCNKIGTYDKALAARDNGVPFYVALPSPTLDPALASGDAIPIETRSPDEVLAITGRDSYGQTTTVAHRAGGHARGQLRVRRHARRGWSPGSSPSAESSRRTAMRLRAALSRAVSMSGDRRRRARAARRGDRDRARDERARHQPRQVGQRQRALARRELRRLPDHARPACRTPSTPPTTSWRCRIDGEDAAAPRRPGAVVGVAVPPRHLSRARRSRRDRPHALRRSRRRSPACTAAFRRSITWWRSPAARTSAARRTRPSARRRCPTTRSRRSTAATPACSRTTG